MGLFSAGSVLAGASIIGSVIGGYNTKKSADRSEDLAEQRASDLRRLAKKEYDFNTGELARELDINLRNLHYESANATFDLVLQARAEESKMMTTTVDKGVETSSYRTDATTKIDNAVAGGTMQNFFDLQFGGKEMIHSYNVNMQQLAIDKEKMERDISLSLGRAKINADNARWGSLADIINTGVSSYDTYYNYRKIDFLGG